MMEFLRLALCAIIGYLLGGFQTGILVARMQNIDLRKHGSGNSGATNALRVMGGKQAGLTLLGDLLKGALAAGLGLLITGYYGGLIGALFVVIGHIWPLYYGFRGGKGVATALGALLVVMPLHTLLLIAIGVIVLLLSKMVSLASLVGAFTFCIAGTITAINRRDWFMLAFVLLMTAIVVFAHRANIRRLLAGEEKANRINRDMFRKK